MSLHRDDPLIDNSVGRVCRSPYKEKLHHYPPLWVTFLPIRATFSENLCYRLHFIITNAASAISELISAFISAEIERRADGVNCGVATPALAWPGKPKRSRAIPTDRIAVPPPCPAPRFSGRVLAPIQAPGPEPQRLREEGLGTASPTGTSPRSLQQRAPHWAHCPTPARAAPCVTHSDQPPSQHRGKTPAAGVASRPAGSVMQEILRCKLRHVRAAGGVIISLFPLVLSWFFGGNCPIMGTKALNA
jgi:hypothetical protein